MTTTDTLITKDQVRDVLAQIVTEFPDRRNDECVYSFDGVTPHCLAAVALDRLGIPLPQNDLNTERVSWLFRCGHLPQMDAEAADYLSRVQREADTYDDGGEDTRGHPTWKDITL